MNFLKSSRATPGNSARSVCVVSALSIKSWIWVLLYKMLTSPSVADLSKIHKCLSQQVKCSFATKKSSTQIAIRKASSRKNNLQFNKNSSLIYGLVISCKNIHEDNFEKFCYGTGIRTHVCTAKIFSLFALTMYFLVINGPIDFSEERVNNHHLFCEKK